MLMYYERCHLLAESLAIRNDYQHWSEDIHSTTFGEARAYRALHRLLNAENAHQVVTRQWSIDRIYDDVDRPIGPHDKSIHIFSNWKGNIISARNF